MRGSQKHNPKDCPTEFFVASAVYNRDVNCLVSLVVVCNVVSWLSMTYLFNNDAPHAMTDEYDRPSL